VAAASLKRRSVSVRQNSENICHLHIPTSCVPFSLLRPSCEWPPAIQITLSSDVRETCCPFYSRPLITTLMPDFAVSYKDKSCFIRRPKQQLIQGRPWACWNYLVSKKNQMLLNQKDHRQYKTWSLKHTEFNLTHIPTNNFKFIHFNIISSTILQSTVQRFPKFYSLRPP
jgi:hypothetical protein